MSYILEALKKEQNQQGQPAAMPSAPVPVAIETRPASIGWGVLLTLAIFAALLAGYWLGQNNQQGQLVAANNPQLTRVIEQAENVLAAKESNAGGQSLASHQEPALSEAQASSAHKAVPANPGDSNKIAAEAYFEHPPAPVKKETEPQLVVSAEKPKPRQIPHDFKVAAQEGVSDDLLARFQDAFDETGNISSEEEDDGQALDASMTAAGSGITPLGSMPMWVQQGVPDLQFELHIFASDGEGWIRVNGEDKYQGDRIAEDLILTQILPQQVILNYRGESFSLPALSNWASGIN